MPIHLPDSHRFRPAENEKVIAVIKNEDRQKRYDFLDIITGVSQGLDLAYWKEGYSIKDANGHTDIFCPGLLYPRSLTVDEVWAQLSERLGAYVFATPPNWRPDPEIEPVGDDRGRGRDRDEGGRTSSSSSSYQARFLADRWDMPVDMRAGGRERERERVGERERERCVMCADRRAYWAVSPPVFLSRHSRRWHVHIDCFQHFMPRRQFGLKPIDVVEYV